MRKNNSKEASRGARIGGGARNARARAHAKLLKRLRRSNPTSWGEPGFFYLRLRVDVRDVAQKRRRMDIPLETCNEEEAVRRAAFVVRTIARLGFSIAGGLALDAEQLREPSTRRRKPPANNGLFQWGGIQL